MDKKAKKGAGRTIIFVSTNNIPFIVGYCLGDITSGKNRPDSLV
jgi:hypothetical protein